MITQSKASIYPVAIWWPDLSRIEYWVKERGANVIWYDKTIHGNSGDFEKAHQQIEALRVQGFNIWMVRQPAYLLGDNLDINFDVKWKSHLYAFDFDDEAEDKVPGGNLWSNPGPILDYFRVRVQQYKAWMSDVPLIANFNGTHISADMRDKYSALIDCGIDILCSDQYPAATQQVRPNGQLLYPDIVQGYVAGTKLLKTWYPHKPVWTYIDSCNQAICPAGQPGWSEDWQFVGSRALTTDELWKIVYYVNQCGGDGLAWFPQARNGAVNDATEPGLVQTMKEIAMHAQPKPLPPGTPVPPGPPVKPKKLIKTVTISIYDDGTVDVK